ncbi:hypothetical protein B0F90DRAFT_1736719 [Multifurca ochricompacta]|uniref:Uncharacterized protein n=1 Tax=Multifurca ochricompacta TaxID=376703 RepID=A0AAD4M1M4_9AGAM|nr:hypothetical protein B0F90DRAFT_1736719 [Multifurca ochricompacta]
MRGMRVIVGMSSPSRAPLERPLKSGVQIAAYLYFKHPLSSIIYSLNCTVGISKTSGKLLRI